MPRITIDGNSVELDRNEAIKDACADLGVPFGCEAGNCGTCVIIVESGMENLWPKNDLEMGIRLSGNERLACQARIGSGDVVATW